MATKHPNKIRVGGNIYELVQTEAPTAGGSNLKKMHRAVDDDDEEESDKFADMPPGHGQPSLEKIEMGMRAANAHLAALRAAHDAESIAQWMDALEPFAKGIAKARDAANEEYSRLTGRSFHFLR